MPAYAIMRAAAKGEKAIFMALRQCGIGEPVRIKLVRPYPKPGIVVSGIHAQHDGGALGDGVLA